MSTKKGIGIMCKMLDYFKDMEDYRQAWKVKHIVGNLEKRPLRLAMPRQRRLFARASLVHRSGGHTFFKRPYYKAFGRKFFHAVALLLLHIK